ncbi:MAG TPA: M50 family metallopeptidase [Actinomycetes bacterium]|nr:M50 family metallopeptidase [Actinomycetes bacterium]
MPMVEGGRPIARFRVLGFPVTVDISFLIVVGILGWRPGVEVRDVVIWVVLAAVSVLVHELGHAVVARTTGASPVITLAGLGGLTSYVPPAPVSRARSIAISVAGPAVGIVIGLVLVAVEVAVDVRSNLWSSVLSLGIYITFFWSVLNLLPILPLDGGQTMRELLPGSRAQREVRAAVVSVVTAVLIAVVAVRAGYVFGALMALFLVAANVMTIRQSREVKQLDVSQQVSRLLWAGRVDDARHLAGERSEELDQRMLDVLAVVGPGDDGAKDGAAAHSGDAGHGEAMARLRSAAQHPTDPTGSTLLLLADRARRDWPSVAETVRSAPALGSAAVVAVQNAAHAEGGDRPSAEIGQAFLDRAGRSEFDGPGHAAHIAYNTACGWASLGDLERGLAAFRRAAELGFTDLTTVDSDPEMAPLRPLPGFDEARGTIRQRALAQSDTPPPGV